MCGRRCCWRMSRSARAFGAALLRDFALGVTVATRACSAGRPGSPVAGVGLRGPRRCRRAPRGATPGGGCRGGGTWACRGGIRARPTPSSFSARGDPTGQRLRRHQVHAPERGMPDQRALAGREVEEAQLGHAQAAGACEGPLSTTRQSPPCGWTVTRSGQADLDSGDVVEGTAARQTTIRALRAQGSGLRGRPGGNAGWRSAPSSRVASVWGKARSASHPICAAEPRPTVEVSGLTPAGARTLCRPHQDCGAGSAGIEEGDAEPEPPIVRTGGGRLGPVPDAGGKADGLTSDHRQFRGDRVDRDRPLL